VTLLFELVYQNERIFFRVNSFVLFVEWTKWLRKIFVQCSAVTFTFQWIFLREIWSLQWKFKPSGILWGTENCFARVQDNRAVWHADHQTAACSLTSSSSTISVHKFSWTLTVSMGTRASNGNYRDEITLLLFYIILLVAFSLIQSNTSEPNQNIQCFLNELSLNFKLKWNLKRHVFTSYIWKQIKSLQAACPHTKLSYGFRILTKQVIQTTIVPFILFVQF